MESIHKYLDEAMVICKFKLLQWSTFRYMMQLNLIKTLDCIQISLQPLYNTVAGIQCKTTTSKQLFIYKQLNIDSIVK